MSEHYNRLAGRGLERIAALSDGVFAIAMTLIVLEVKVPTHGSIHSEAELWAALCDLTPRLVTYCLSFLTLGIFWVGQGTQLGQIERADRDYSWLQLAFLALVAVMPFSTEFLAEFITFRLALAVYYVNILLLGVFIFASWRCALRHGLARPEVTPEIDRAVRQRVIRAQTFYAIGLALCVFNTYWSIGFIVAVQLNYAIALRVSWVQRVMG